jgi:hypothetical protein
LLCFQNFIPDPFFVLRKNNEFSCYEDENDLKINIENLNKNKFKCFIIID